MLNRLWLCLRVIHTLSVMRSWYSSIVQSAESGFVNTTQSISDGTDKRIYENPPPLLPPEKDVKITSK